MFGKRILILAAHPDDEVVACAAAIGRARAEGATLCVLYLTHGCLSSETLWPWQRAHYKKSVDIRKTEADTAATFLGIQPVGISDRPARSLWPQLPKVLSEVEAALSLYRPDQLWVPAYEGGNPDHDGLNAIGFKLKMRLSVLEFAEYNFFGGRVRSQTFISPEPNTHIHMLTAEERASKKAALKIYRSEKSNLSSLKIVQESYRPLTAYDYSRPPHQGTLWYARYQWVPFRHPRVDFTQGQNVSDAIMDFLSR